MSIVNTGVPGVTVNEFAKVTTSAFVVSITLRRPVVAAESILITAARLVAEVTVTETTVIPGPKLAVVIPCEKCVY